MPISELVDYIQEQTQQGVTAQDLRVCLMEAGWLESDITNALHDVAAGLYPTTPGASIHEDLAQVRTVVANLASRVYGIEATLAYAPVRHQWLGRMGMFVVLMALFGVVGVYATDGVAQRLSASVDYLVIATLIGALFLVGAMVSMRRKSAWTASLCTASAISLWGMVTFISWRVYHVMEWTTSVGLVVLMLAIIIVMGSWIQRYSVR